LLSYAFFNATIDLGVSWLSEDESHFLLLTIHIDIAQIGKRTRSDHIQKSGETVIRERIS